MTPDASVRALPNLPDGEPLAQGATAADTIAALAGVDFRGVQRMLAAIEAMRRAGYDLEQITRLDHVPLFPAPRPTDHGHSAPTRWVATQRLAATIGRKQQVRELAPYLRLDRVYR